MKLKVTNLDEALSFYGHGKLLITSEYFVLDGALALAVPTKFGQTLRVRPLHSGDSTLYWVALNNKKQAWLNLVFDTTDFTCLNAQTPETGRLTKMLQQARKQNPAFLADKKDYAVETALQFPNEWGLGSSSTLIHCLAEWAQVNAHELLQNTIGGSGYDVACAGSNTPLIYRLENGKPVTMKAKWQPAFSDSLYFVYTGKKQLSSEGISHYRTALNDKTHGVKELSRITELLLKAETLDVFEELINEHENIVGAQLKMIKVKDSLFSDYWGSVKSLGAWGGDFVLMTNTKGKEELSAYLQSKQIDTLFSWDELLLT
ncbi:MAG: GYDIA family GHMP kinase [Chitinophagales bacterium]